MEGKKNRSTGDEDNSTKDGETSGYAPRSPDLSSFYSDSPTRAAAAAPQVEQSPTGLPVHQARYKLQSPSCSYSPYSADSNPYSYAQHARHTRHTQQTPGSAPHSHQHQHPNPNLELHPAQARPPSRPLASQPSPAPGYDYSAYSAPQFQSTPGQHRPHSSSRPGNDLQSTDPPPFPTREQQRLAKTSTAESSAFATPSSFSSASSTLVMPPRKAAAPPPPPPAVEPSPVKTKFPTARIKRIMQADEEVGKVSQQTPIAVGKALELFMIQLVSKSADVAKEKGSKRVTASMLKQVVETDEQWDFLRDIVSRVENEKEASKAKAKESESDEEMEEPKKRGRGGGRRKKSAV